MTEILTESFCERCGTRYTFESAAPRKSRLGRVRVLGKGMRNFVMSDDSSFSEAMADARSEEEIAATAHQLDAFHQAFNFCLTCRQYTCGECWNTAEGRCLTCAPIPGMELPVVAEAVLVDVAPETVAAASGNGHAPIEEAWPDEDLSSARLARALGMDEAEAEAVSLADFETAIEPEPVVAATAPVDVPEVSAIETPLEDQRAVEAVDAATDDASASHLMGIAPGQSLEDAIAEYEAQLAADEALAHPAAVAPAVGLEPPVVEAPDAPPAVEPVAAVAENEPDGLDAAVAAATLAHVAREAEPETPEAAVPALDAEPLAAAAPQPAITEPAPVEPAPVEAAPEPAPVAMTAVEPEPLAAAGAPDEETAARDDIVAQPTWPTPTSSTVAPAPTAPVPGEAPANPWLTVAPEDPAAQPQWPAAPAWPVAANRRDMPTTLAGRPILPEADPSGLWAASAREVLTGAAQPAPAAAAVPAPTAQPCVSCGLSLSANARFCRRCGTRQG